MNDRVEEIYKQMFAPSPVPQSVRDAYERTLFLANRIDCQLTVGALVLIAAIATESPKRPVGRPRKEQELGETLPAQEDAETTYVTVPALQTPAETQTAPKPMDAPLGPMDAPAMPEPPLQRGMSEKRLMLLTASELRAHAKEFYGLDAKKNWGKKKIVNVIHTMNPIKPGAQAKHPSEVKKYG